MIEINYHTEVQIHEVMSLQIQSVVRMSRMSIRVGLIWSTLRYQFWSGTSERTMSEDSKNVFGISVAIIQTRHGPLKATASTL